MRLIKPIISCLISAVILTNIACGKSELLTNANLVLSSFRSVLPLVSTIIPNDVDKINQGIDIAEKLRTAIENKDFSNAIDLASNLIPTLEDIVNNDLPQLTDEKLRATILVALSGADIGLHFLASYLVSQPKEIKDKIAGASDISVITSFNKKVCWGTAYYKK